MTWNDYYEKFYEWAQSTQIKKIYFLTDFGAPDEIWEIAYELDDPNAVNLLIQKARLLHPIGVYLDGA